MKLNDLRSIKDKLILMKKEGMTVPEIANLYAPKIDDADFRQVRERIRCYWDSYVRKLSSEDDDVVTDTPKAPAFSKATAESQDVVTNSDGSKDSSVTIQESHLKGSIVTYSKEDLLRLHGFTPVEDWELISCRSSQWQAQAAGGDIVNMVASKVSACPKDRRDEMIAEIIRSNVAKFDLIGKADHPVPKNNPDADQIAIVPIADFHLDKREADNCYMPFETQVERFCAILDWHYNQLKKNKDLKKIVFYWSQDFFNYDYLTEETTSRRNKQDSSAGYIKMVQNGNMLLVNAILKLEELAPVELFYTRSNHDQQTALNTMCGLFVAFRNDENVLIDGMTAEERRLVWENMSELQALGLPVEYDALFDTAGRHYLMWGETLFGFAHGDTEGQRIHNVMQVEADDQFARLYAKKNNLHYDHNLNDLPDFPEKFAWSKTLNHIFFCGHFHSKQKLVKDESGVEVIYLGTEMTGDAWHKNCGFIGAQQRIEQYIYDRRGGYDVKGIQSRTLKERWEEKQAEKKALMKEKSKNAVKN